MIRKLAVDVLTTVERDGAYSNLLLNEVYEKHELTLQDKGLMTNIVYGTLQKKSLLDFYLDEFLNGKKMKLWVRYVFRTALYQMLFLDKIPNHAILNESVKITKKKYGQQTGNFVNAILRKIKVDELKSLDSITDDIKRLSVETSHPEWILKMWSKQYSFETAKNIAFSNIEPPHRSARVNPHLANRDDVLSDEIKVSPVSDFGVLFREGNIAHSDLFKDGIVTIQDESSMLVAPILDPQPGEVIIDVCAAPGGKTTHIASLMNNKGTVYAHDLYDHKIELINENAKRQKLNIIKASKLDGLLLPEKYEEGSIDRVLLDAPCSGFGVIKRKPDILHHKVQNDLDDIINIQEKLLESVSGLIKVNGVLVYSTCTINKKENEKQVEKFIKNHPEFEVVEEKLIMPFDYNSDGFYICKMKKSN
jgi:16S rRNA (cytosine967-C5)-methyltransferase